MPIAKVIELRGVYRNNLIKETKHDQTMTKIITNHIH